MTKLIETFKSEASPEAAWALLADFGNIDFFNPNLKSSYLLEGSTEQGVGTLRQCNLLDGKNYIRERVVEWNEGQSYTIEIYDGTMPLKNILTTLRVAPFGTGSLLTMEMEYTPKYGLLGTVMNVVILKSYVEKMMRKVLSGLDAKAAMRPMLAA